MKKQCRALLISAFLMHTSINGCRVVKAQANEAVSNSPPLEMTTHFFIGLDDQPVTHYLSLPRFIRTDSEQNIYIYDQASISVNVFNDDGQLVRTIGRAGQGPGEFQMIGLLEISPDDHVITLDRTRFTYSRFDNQGKLIETVLLGPDSQIYPARMLWAGDELVTLDFRQNSNFNELQLEEEFLIVRGLDFQDVNYAFGSTGNLGFDSRFAKAHLLGQGLTRNGSGSIAISDNLDQIVYSPGIYNGKLYFFERQGNGSWNAAQTVDGTVPLFEGSYRAYPRIEAMDQFQIIEEIMSMDLPVRRFFVRDAIRFAVGVVMSYDAGVHYLNDGRIIQFVQETVEGENRDWEGHNFVYELYAQIFRPDGAFQSRSHLTTLNYGLRAPIWKDNEDIFYSLETFEGMAVMRKFSLVPD